ncbi:MAG: BatA domain-containing protein [Planctomycetota bacterium]
MGLLAPIYALAALAIAGPILFHLIRRQPQGQKQFSSLMFLQPSPPTLSRRSRIDQWLLLLLRALAIALIAFAFARPYFREDSFLSINLDGRNVVMVVDTSASMQRDDVWQAAQQEAKKILGDLSAEDRISLYTLDRELRPVVALEGDAIVDPPATHDAVRQALDELEPTWLASELAEGITAAADMLSSAAISGGVHAGRSSEIVLITDLHTKSGLESLQGYPWPEKIGLDVRQIAPSELGNARASLMVSEDSGDSDAIYRVRIENNSNSEQSNLQLAWANDRGPIDGTFTQLQVPAGQVRVLAMSSRPAGANRIRLLGDAWEDDNDVYVVEYKKTRQPIAFVGRKADKPEDDAGYFLQKAPLSTALVEREVLALRPDELPTVLAEGSTRSLVVEPVADVVSQAAIIRDFASSGGSVLVLLSSNEDQSQAQFLQELLDTPDLTVGESELSDFALIGWVDYRSPVFSPFADPRFNDFSKIRFWSHRNLGLPNSTDTELSSEEPKENANTIKTVARFDDLAPLLVRQRVDKGNIWVLTAGWQPSASGLALSTKFLPILAGILDPSGKLRQSQATFAVGESIPFENEDVEIVNSEGESVEDTVARVGLNGIQFYKPGIYSLKSAEISQQIAVQIPANESQLVPQDKAVFDQYGVSLGRIASDTQRKDSARQMQIEELEKKQRMWQWLIALGLVVLAVETSLAGWFARRNAAQLATT